MATVWFNTLIEHFTHVHFWGVSNRRKMPILGKFAHFAPRQICRTTWIWVKCFTRVLKHTMAMTKIDLRKKLELKWPENVDFSNISKYPIHFLWISYIKYDPPGGESNDLQKCRKFFSKLFMIFLHKKKNADENLKKMVFLEHPITGAARPKF